MKDQLATALALALVVGAVGLAAVPIALATHNDCHEESTLSDYPISTDGELDNSNPVDLFKFTVPTTDPDSGLPIDKAAVRIDATSGDIDWVVSEEVLGSCNEVASDTSASEDPDALISPGEYFLRMEPTGTSASYDLVVETDSTI